MAGTAQTGVSLPVTPGRAAASGGAQGRDRRQAFFAYVRGASDQVPEGYAEAGMRVYRHLVYLGAIQMVEASHPGLRDALGDAPFETLLRAFVREARWTSPLYGELNDDFLDFLRRAGGAGP